MESCDGQVVRRHAHPARTPGLDRLTAFLIGIVLGMFLATSLFVYAVVRETSRSAAGTLPPGVVRPPSGEPLELALVPAAATADGQPEGTPTPLGAPDRHEAVSVAATAPSTLRGWATVDEGQARGHAAAGPALRRALGGDPAFRGEAVTVVKGKQRIVVRLTDWCACGKRHDEQTLIDLNPSDYRTLTGRDPGIAWVRVIVNGKSIPLPPTDTSP